MRRFLPILIVVFMAASVLIFFFGDSGLYAYRTLENYKENLSANVENLQLRNQDLTADLISLKDNPDRTLVMARGIGLYRQGDEVVKLEGLPPRGQFQAIGDFLKMRKESETRSAIFKAAALGVSLLLLAYALFSSRASRRRLHGGQG